MSKNQNFSEITGQYPSDKILHGMPEADPYGVMTRGDGDIAMHSPHARVLFDEGFGIVDEADGSRGTHEVTLRDEVLALEGMGFVTKNRGRTKTEIDEAEAWLRDNDPDHPLYKK